MKYNIQDILAQYGPLLTRVASTYEASEDIRQELYQEICVAVWQGLARFKGDASVKTYILRIAHNRCITHVTKESKSPKSVEYSEDFTTAQAGVTSDECFHTESMAESGSVLTTTASMVSQNPERKVSQSQRLTRLLNEIRLLPMPSKQVITLSMEGLSYQEIADISGLTVNNVGVMITRLKKELQGKMQDE